MPALRRERRLVGRIVARLRDLPDVQETHKIVTINSLQSE